MSSPPVLDVMAAQRAWAERSGLQTDARGYLPDVQTNLCQDLSANARAAFEAGDGAEMDDREGRPAKMRSLISSSALAANVFDYWSGRDLAPLLQALGVEGRAVDLQFERKLPTGARGKAPNLDIVLTLDDGRLVGIESKFTEWMTPKPGMPASLAPYLRDHESPWTRAGLPAADRLARAVHDGHEWFRLLNVPQLLKHALGLARASAPGWTLRYLYFDGTGPTAAEHAREIDRFAGAVGRDLGFAALSYQRFVGALADAGGEAPAYTHYLRDRYFPPPAR